MILKDKTFQNAVSPKAKAGQKQEQDVAYFLRRAFKDHKEVFVINDFKFTHNNETAQIDHLIVYTFGFILIESKSIKGEVKVNGLGEWARSLYDKWSGMASPIKQVELQQELLKALLLENRESILSKVLGFKQRSFETRCWNTLCVVSSHALIERDSMPNEVSKQLVKTEFLVEKINKVMNLKTNILKVLSIDSRPEFNENDLKSITSFLMKQQKTPKQVQKREIKEVAQPVIEEKTSVTTILQCKSCGEKSDYTAQYGRYGYFIKCNKCEANTAMKMPCVKCGSKNTKVTKKKESYTLNCNDCQQSSVLI